MIELFAQNSFDMEFMLKRLIAHYHIWEVTINISKTEYMAANFQILISNEQVKQMDNFKYLDI